MKKSRTLYHSGWSVVLQSVPAQAAVEEAVPCADSDSQCCRQAPFGDDLPECDVQLVARPECETLQCLASGLAGLFLRDPDSFGAVPQDVVLHGSTPFARLSRAPPYTIPRPSDPLGRRHHAVPGCSVVCFVCLVADAVNSCEQKRLRAALGFLAARCCFSWVKRRNPLRTKAFTRRGCFSRSQRCLSPRKRCNSLRTNAFTRYGCFSCTESCLFPAKARNPLRTKAFTRRGCFSRSQRCLSPRKRCNSLRTNAFTRCGCFSCTESCLFPAKARNPLRTNAFTRCGCFSRSQRCLSPRKRCNSLRTNAFTRCGCFSSTESCLFPAKARNPLRTNAFTRCGCFSSTEMVLFSL